MDCRFQQMSATIAAQKSWSRLTEVADQPHF
jgi:hypothetical protein